MMPWEMGVAMVLNASIAVRLTMAGDPAMGLVFAAYAVACVGFMWKVWA